MCLGGFSLVFMNILQLVPKLNIGGVEKGTVEVARYLTLKGHKAVVVSGGGPLEKKLSAVGARHYVLPIGRKNPFVMIHCYFKLKKLIKKENIDIVHARSRIPALTGALAARAMNKTFMTTAHGQYKKKLISRVMGWGKVVIVANETMARYMKDNFDVPLRKIEIVPRGVDLKKFSFVPREEKNSRKFRVGMVSRFTPLKGHLDFLKAASYALRRIPNLEIVLMGDRAIAREEYIKKIDLSIKQLMLDNIVKFVDSSQDVAEVMGSLDVIVSANREQEAFGRTIIEAQARGVPVVATRIGGVVENIEDGSTGLLCDPCDPQGLAEKIVAYSESPRLMADVARKAREHVERKYSLEDVMSKTLDVYSRALDAENILIFKISSLGDIILSTPSIRAIRQRFKSASIKVLTDVRFREVLQHCPYIDEIIACDFNGRDKGSGFLRLAAKLRSEDFDISVDLQNNKKSHLLAFLAMARERYGYDNRKWSFLLNRKISMPRSQMGPVEHQSGVLGLLGITGINDTLELWPGEEAESRADRLLKDNWMKSGQKLVAVSLSASKRWLTKNWPISSIVELSELLAKEKGIRMVIVGSSEDKDLAREFVKRTSAKPIDLTGKTNVLELAAVIEKCEALLTGDSAPVHVAAAVGTPFVVLFGPTDPARHAPPANDFKVLRKKLRCSPCYKPTCIRNVKCLTSIKVEEVYEALKEVMRD